MNKDLWQEITKNQKVKVVSKHSRVPLTHQLSLQLLQSIGVSPGDNIMLLNDIVLGEDQVDIYQYVAALSPDTLSLKLCPISLVWWI